jgi:aminoglycoside 6'-N-acetyltransferase I
MADVLIRPAVPSDLEGLADLCFALWPESPREEHRQELTAILAGRNPSTLPLLHFVAETEEGRLIGFLEVGLRSHADCCDVAQPVGYIEGWYVVEAWRRQGVGRQLLAAAEEWARGQGCREMASDSLLENALSERAHRALGYEVVGRSVLYRKGL